MFSAFGFQLEYVRVDGDGVWGKRKGEPEFRIYGAEDLADVARANGFRLLPDGRREVAFPQKDTSLARLLSQRDSEQRVGFARYLSDHHTHGRKR